MLATFVAAANLFWEDDVRLNLGSGHNGARVGL